jgi:hypothetical protein
MILVTLNSMMLIPARRGGKSHGSTFKTKELGDLEKGQGARFSPSFDVAKSCCSGDVARVKPQCTTGEKQHSCCHVPKSREPTVTDDGCCREGKPNSHAKHATKDGRHGCCASIDANADESSDEFSF